MEFDVGLDMSHIYIIHTHTTDVKCFSVPDDVDDTEIVVHPIVPEGTVLGDLAESSPDDYVMGKAYFEAVRDVISTCEATDKYQLATYPWLDSNDFTTPVSSYAIVTILGCIYLYFYCDDAVSHETIFYIYYLSTDYFRLTEPQCQFGEGLCSLRWKHLRLLLRTHLRRRD